MRSPSGWSWLLFAVAACTGAPTMQAPRPLSAPFDGAARVARAWFLPAAMARDVREMRATAGRILADELDLGTARATLARLGEEPRRIADLRATTGSVLGREVDRLADLRRARGFDALDPRPDLVQLVDDLKGLPQLLRLDQHPLGEPDDPQHRTDPDDRRPVAGFGARLLRRLFP